MEGVYIFVPSMVIGNLSLKVRVRNRQQKVERCSLDENVEEGGDIDD